MPQLRLSEMPAVLASIFSAQDPEHGSKAKERRNVVLLEHMLRVVAFDRFNELREYLADDVTFEYAVPVGVPFARWAEGPEAVAQAIRGNFALVKDQSPEPLALVAQGDIVIMMVRETGRWADTGVSYRMMAAQQFTFRDDRLVAFRGVVASLE